MKYDRTLRFVSKWSFLFGAVFILGTLSATYFAIWSYEKRIFDFESDQFSSSVFDYIREAKNSIGVFTALYSSSDVDSDAFRIVSEQILKQSPVINSLSFARRVAEDEKNEFEEIIRKIAPEYQIQSQNSQIDADKYYLLTQHYEPLGPTTMELLGVNLLSAKHLSPIALQAISDGKLHTSAPITNGQGLNVFYLLRAIYTGKIYPEEEFLRQKSALGVILVELNIPKIISSLALPKEFNIELFDVSEIDNREFKTSIIGELTNVSKSQFFHFATLSTQKNIQFAKSDGYIFISTKYISWTLDKILFFIFVFAAGALFTYLFNSRIQAFIDFQQEIQHQVEVKTAIIEEQKSKIANSAKLSSLGEMAGGIAHEINTPLAVIKLTSNRIQEDISAGNLSDETLLMNINKIETTVDRIALIISGLRSFSRDASVDPIGDVNIKKVIESTLSFCQENLKVNGIALKVSPIPENLEIKFKEVQLSQVLLNLLNNSKDEVKKITEKWIAIDVFDLKDAVEICVTDSGNGIPAEIQDKIFLPFYTTKGVGNGTGLGLSVSLGIVKAHNGTLTVDNNSPNTKFVIRLPKAS